jgi:hypothetical protein
MSLETKVRNFRERAEELRTIAQDFVDPETRRMLGRLAMDYEHMAESLARAHAPPRPDR